MSKIREEWRPVIGYEGLYEVSDWGNVRSVDRTFEYYHPTANRKIKRIFKGQLLKKVIDKDGYYKVSLYNKDHKCNEGKVHRLVGEAFIPNPNKKPQIDHINGCKTDNVVWNIRWSTSLENSNNPITMEHMRGIQNGRQINRPDMSKKVYQYDSDWHFIAEYPSASEAGRVLGCHFDTITKACRGVRHSALGYKWAYNRLN